MIVLLGPGCTRSLLRTPPLLLLNTKCYMLGALARPPPNLPLSFVWFLIRLYSGLTRPTGLAGSPFPDFIQLTTRLVTLPLGQEWTQTGNSRRLCMSPIPLPSPLVLLV